jgi:hypothetical protein
VVDLKQQRHSVENRGSTLDTRRAPAAQAERKRKRWTEEVEQTSVLDAIWVAVSLSTITIEAL